MSKPTREQWLKELAEFIVTANKNTWAAGGEQLPPDLPDFKKLQYPNPPTGDWLLVDHYSGYFQAPGFTNVYYKGIPVWTMAYYGPGMHPDYYQLTKGVFKFLKEALMQVTPEMPYRGPKIYRPIGSKYTYRLGFLYGDITNFIWAESINMKPNRRNAPPVFLQRGGGGLVLWKEDEEQVVYPWDL